VLKLKIQEVNSLSLRNLEIMKFLSLPRTGFALLILLIGFSLPSRAQTEKLTWYSDIKKAQEISAASNKPIFAFFTGSDWCGWCKKLQKDVFAKEDFQKWAKDNVVLLELDYPSKKQLPEEIVKQNAELQQVFKVGSFPTIWLFYLKNDPETKKINISALGSFGYPSGAEPGKEEVKFLATANGMIDQYKKGK
jgi:thiol-disulfide isomerase/thioredoxin